MSDRILTKSELKAFQRYTIALDLPDTPEHRSWWLESRAPDKKCWEWHADTPFQEMPHAGI